MCLCAPIDSHQVMVGGKWRITSQRFVQHQVFACYIYTSLSLSLYIYIYNVLLQLWRLRDARMDPSRQAIAERPNTSQR